MKVYFLANEKWKKCDFSIKYLSDIWRGFDVAQRKAFRLFLDSPFFNQKEMPLLIFDHLFDPLRKGTQTLSGRLLCKRFFREVNDGNIELLKNEFKLLQKLTEQFLIYYEVREDDLLKKKLLVKVYKNHKSSLFLKAANQYQKKLNQNKSTLVNIQEKWWLNDQLFFHQYPSTITRETKYLVNAEKKSKELLQVVQLKNLIARTNRNTVYTAEENKEENYRLIYGKPLTKLADIFQKTIHILIESTVLNKHYKAFKKTFNETSNELSEMDKYLLVKIASNCCAWAVVQGEKEAMKEVFYWNTVAMKKQLFFNEGEISDTEYINVVLSALFVKEYQILKRWMKVSTPYLNSKVKKRANDLIKGYLLIDDKKYEEAIEFLNENFTKESKNTIVYTIRVKALLLYAYLMYYFDTGETMEEFFICRNNYLDFIKNNKKVNKGREASIQNYISFCEKILQLHEDRIDLSKNKLNLRKTQLLEDLKGIKIISMTQPLTEAIHTIQKL